MNPFKNDERLSLTYPKDVKAINGEERCCGGPAPKGVDACCVKDADAKEAGLVGCDCS